MKPNADIYYSYFRYCQAIMFKKLFNRKPEDKSAEETSGSLHPGDIIFSTGSNEFYKAIRSFHRK
ncbi:MAG: hypothetical protein WDN26_20135 [Chitinophagaceae bacterium]